MSINLYIARHGNTFESNQIPVMVGKQTDLKLTQKGEEQARKLKEVFKDINFEAVFSGNLARQKRFAKIISNPAVVKFSSALDEIDYGSWEGLETSKINNFENWSKKGIWQDAFIDKEEQRVSEILNFINTIRSQFEPGANVLAISSNGIIRQFAKFSEVSNSETVWSRLSEAGAIGKLKVATGNYCRIDIQAFNLNIDFNQWNISGEC